MAADLRFRAMGTWAHVIVVGDDRLLDAARHRVDDLEQRWSRFIASSEVSRLNARRGRPVAVSADTRRLVSTSVAAWAATAGRFDPTVLGDLLRAGYDDTYAVVAVRGGGGISLLRRNCGGIVVDDVAGTVCLPPDTGFDPGGIGKGLAADLVVEELLGLGAHGACVNLGGDLRVEGVGDDDGRWIIALEDPADDSTIVRVGLAAGGVATSTIRKRTWLGPDGRRRHHVIDPSTGSASLRRAASVAALARTAAMAEVAATSALLALPGEELSALSDLGCDGRVTTFAGAHLQTRNLDSYALTPATT